MKCYAFYTLFCTLLGIVQFSSRVQDDVRCYILLFQKCYDVGSKPWGCRLLYLWIFWLCYFWWSGLVRETGLEDWCSIHFCSREGMINIFFVVLCNGFGIDALVVLNKWFCVASNIPAANWGLHIQSNSKHFYHCKRIPWYCLKVP